MASRSEAFPLPLVLEAGELQHGVRQWTLKEPFRYVGSRGAIDVPAGFVTDLASVPKLFHNICGPADELLFASIPHDWLYSTGNGTKADADLVFLEALQKMGVPWHKRNAAYWGVRLFGRGNFRKV